MKYMTAVIDPPWPYERVGTDARLSGFVEQEGNEHYGTMTLERLAALPVRELVDGYLFVWATGPFVPAAVDLVRAWGFTHRTMMYWVKRSKEFGGQLAYGPGYWVRSAVEPIIIASTSRVKAVRTNESAALETHPLQDMLSPRLRHSRKPEELQDMIEKHFPEPRLELFARRQRPGWRCMGNELSGLDIEDEMRREIAA